MAISTDNDKWDIIIKPKTKKFELNIKEVWAYKDLMMLYVNRNITTVYKQTILGPLWFFIQPIFSTIMFMFIYGGIAKIPTDGIPQPLFYMAGLVLWGYFTDCLSASSSTFSGNANVFSKVYFPRLVVPFSSAISNLLKFGIQLLLFISIYTYFALKGTFVNVNEYALLFPLLVVMLAGMGLGLGIIISSLTVKYRDIAILISFAIQLWQLATPIAYPMSVLKETFPKLAIFIELNPLSSIFEAFKYGVLGAGDFSWGGLLYSFVFTIVVIIVGSWVFNKVEKRFIDIV
ncbi:lipopolysaccharide transport system permease protein [Dysgonomonas sp. PH5-45]|uniref:ABC transporter permease n=1 Tax=unclassified Dysgonomonas TaxID=2630389 RepID=UPI002474D394|nr:MULTISPECIES: ABC transporter permease [unclassified Dysgonomonas]MDH6355279.1 lipopolysaccharide transport system permease protein [Dysgonomonas sp. PH5-45]MDH6388195.1 lipopolysaccharide transport system permease protein [Dysgonomonas sp. PH5-37]